MPFKSKAQQRFMFAAQERGDLPKGTAEKWAKHTPDIKSLPEKVKKKKYKAKKDGRKLKECVLKYNELYKSLIV